MFSLSLGAMLIHPLWRFIPLIFLSWGKKRLYNFIWKSRVHLQLFIFFYVCPKPHSTYICNRTFISSAIILIYKSKVVSCPRCPQSDKLVPLIPANVYGDNMQWRRLGVSEGWLGWRKGGKEAGYRVGMWGRRSGGKEVKLGWEAGTQSWGRERGLEGRGGGLGCGEDDGSHGGRARRQ